MKSPGSILCGLMLVWTSVNAQNTFSFKAQLYDNKLGPRQQVKVLVDNKYPAVTDNAGVFEVALPNNTTHIRVSLPDQGYTILYPFGGYVPIPKDLKDVPQVVIGTPKENAYFEQYLKLYQLIKKKNVNPSIDISLLTKKMDSLENTLINLHYTESDLRTAKQVQDGKDDYYAEITADLIQFRNAVFDLNTEFKAVPGYLFNNQNAILKLHETMSAYTIIFNKLSRQRANYEKRVSDYWLSDTLTVSFRALMDYFFNTVHLQTLYPMQATVTQINEYFQSSKSNDLRKKISDEIDIHVKRLENVIPRLDSSTNQVLNQLNY